MAFSPRLPTESLASRMRPTVYSSTHGDGSVSYMRYCGSTYGSSVWEYPLVVYKVNMLANVERSMPNSTILNPNDPQNTIYGILDRN